MLAIDNITVGYRSKQVIGGLTLSDIEPGSLVGILGPNGAGKSTLLKAVAGLHPHQGSIRVMGDEVTAMKRRARSLAIGYLPQTLPLQTTLVAYEAVYSACRAVRPDLTRQQAELAVEKTFRRLGITHLAMSGLNELSGGQRQMVGLAQILVREPPVMLLDEPTSALDLRWQLGVLDVVREITAENGHCCLVALHDLNLAMRHCDRIAVMRDGALIADGPPTEAMTSEVLRQAYAVEGRIELCSQGSPHVITDRVAPQAGQQSVMI